MSPIHVQTASISHPYQAVYTGLWKYISIWLPTFMICFFEMFSNNPITIVFS